MKTYILIILLLFPLVWCAQGFLPLGARSQSMAGASVAQQDLWAVHHNPSAVAFVEHFEIGTFYQSRFLIQELQSQALCAVLPIQTGAFSLGGQFYGSQYFRTNRLGLGYALKLAKNFSVGLQINYLNLRIPNYTTKHLFTGELGLLVKINENWSLGAAVFNIGRTRFRNKYDERLSTAMRIGALYQLSKQVQMAFEIEQYTTYNPRVKVGLEYEIHKKVLLRAGIAGKPIECSFGMAYQLKKLNLELGTSYQQVLGWSPHLGMNFKLMK